jgi:hypothetical protein
VKCNNGKCGNNQVCNMGTDQCTTNPVNTCWSVPSICNFNDPKHMKFCPGNGGGSTCMSICQALKAEKPFGQDLNACP